MEASPDTRKEKRADRNEDDFEIAKRLADEVARAAAEGRRRSWRKVTTLLAMFGVYRFTPLVRDRLATALESAGLEVEPSLSSVDRGDTVRLSIATEGRPDSSTAGASVFSEDVMAVTRWNPEQHPAESGRRDSTRQRGVVWIDISPSADAEDVHRNLEPICGGGLTREMVEDLLDADPLPKRRVHRTESGGKVFSASAVAVEAIEPAEGDGKASKAGTLRFSTVELVAGNSWIVSCRHSGQYFRGNNNNGEEDPVSLNHLQRNVAELWVGQGFRTVGDLGTLIFQELAGTYQRALRTLYAWLESWELYFYDKLNETALETLNESRGNDDKNDNKIEHETLNELRGLVAEFRRRVQAFDPETRKGNTVPWFDNVSQPELTESIGAMVDRSLADLQLLADRIRGSMDLLTSQSVAKQLELSERSARQSKRLQDLLALVTSVFLVPALVLAIFGANTELPGRNTWTGFALMMALTVLSAVLTYVGFRALTRADSTRRSRSG